VSMLEWEPHTGQEEPGSAPPRPIWSMIVYDVGEPRHSALKSSPLKLRIVWLLLTSHIEVSPVRPLLHSV